MLSVGVVPFVAFMCLVCRFTRHNSPVGCPFCMLIDGLGVFTTRITVTDSIINQLATPHVQQQAETDEEEEKEDEDDEEEDEEDEEEEEVVVEELGEVEEVEEDSKEGMMNDDFEDCYLPPRYSSFTP